MDETARKHGIQRIIVPPPYQYPGDFQAPLRRNKLMLELCDHVIALWDGRKEGGTYRTVQWAREQGKPTRFLTPI